MSESVLFPRGTMPAEIEEAREEEEWEVRGGRAGRWMDLVIWIWANVSQARM